MPLVYLGAAIVLLLALIAWLKLNPFVALILASFLVGIVNGMAPQAALGSILKGLGERATLDAAVARAMADWSLDLPGVLREWHESLPAGSAESVAH